MPSQIDAYRFKDGQTPLSAETFNVRFADIDTRLVSVEDVKPSWEAAVEQLRATGLARINEALAESYDKITAATTAVDEAVADLQATVLAAIASMQGQLSGIDAQAAAAVSAANTAIANAGTATTNANTAIGTANAASAEANAASATATEGAAVAQLLALALSGD